MNEAMENYWSEKGAGTWHVVRTSVLEQIRPDRESFVLHRNWNTKNLLYFHLSCRNEVVLQESFIS